MPTQAVAPSRPSPAEPTKLTVSVTSKMMQDYREEVPAREATRVALGWTETGDAELFSVGSDTELYVVRRDPASASGWTADRAGFTDVKAIATYDVAARHDRVFALGRSASGTHQFAELVRGESGQYAPRFLGMTVATQSLGVAPCDADVVVLAAAAGADNRPVYGVLPERALFTVEGVRAAAVACVPHASTRWPHLPLVTLDGGRLSAYRGVRTSAEAGERPAAESIPWEKLAVEPVPLPPLAGAMDFAVVSLEADAVLLLAIDGTHALHSLVGRIDAEIPGLVRWGEAWTRLELTREQRPSFSWLDTERLPDGRVQVLLREDVGSNLWVTGRNVGGVAAWDEAVNLGIPAARFAVNANDVGETMFVTANGADGLALWSRDATGDWRPEPVMLATGAVVRQVVTHRTGLVVTDGYNAGVAGLTARLSASDDVAVVVNGRRCFVGAERWAEVSTNAYGALNLTTDVTNSLYAPVLFVEADFLAGGRIEIRTDAAIQSYLRTVTPQQLLAGSDPFSGRQVLAGAHHNDDAAAAVSTALARVCAMADPLYEPLPAPASCPVTLRAQRGVRFSASPFESALRLPPPGTGPWSFGLESGRAVFRTLTRAEADAAFARARAEAEAGDFLGIDWGSVLESVENAVSDVLKVVVDGASAALTVVLNGVERVIELAVETVEQVFDLVAAVLDIVGTLLGVAVGWLLSVIGFLFGWDRIKETRDRLRERIFELSREMRQRIPDPAESAGFYREKLRDLRTEVRAWIADIERQPIGSGAFHGLIGTVPTLPSFFSGDGGPFADQATWLLEKAIEALGKVVGEFGAPDIPGMKEAIETLMAKASEAGAMLLALGESLFSGRVEPWVAELAKFESASLGGFFGWLAEKVDAIVDFLEGVFDAVVEILHLAWANGEAMVQWLDRELYVPFLSAFYEQVLGNDLSLFDVACLAIAVPLSILGADPFALELGASSTEVTALTTWAIVHSITEPLHLAFPQMCALGKILADLFLGAFGVMAVAFHSEGWAMLGRVMVTVAVVDMVQICLPEGPAAGPAGAMLLLAFSLPWVQLYALTVPQEVATIGALLFLSGMLSRFMPSLPATTRLNNKVIAGYGVLQGAFAGSIAGLWAQYAPGPGGSARRE